MTSRTPRRVVGGRDRALSALFFTCTYVFNRAAALGRHWAWTASRVT
jgi:hypothetical protein